MKAKLLERLSNNIVQLYQRVSRKGGNKVIDKIQITLNSGQKYSLKSADELDDINPNKTAIFLFNNGQIFVGKSDGCIEFDEEGNDTFIISKDKTKFCLAFPINRLVGWAYEKESEVIK